MALGGSVTLTVEELFEKNDKERLRCFSFYKADDKKYTGADKPVLAMLNEFRKEETSGFCDVVIRVEGVDMPAHRCILAANSKLFYNMFNSGMRESEEKVLKLQSVPSGAMRSLLEYFYTREITISEEGLEELLDAANFLLVKPVEQACFEVMSEKLGFSNCFTLKYLAQKYDVSDLFKKADNFIKKNFARVWRESEEFVGLSWEELADLISSDEILVKSEEDVYSAVMKWVNYDVANRKGFLAQLLSRLRCGSLTKPFIKGRLLNDPLIKECQASSGVLETWMKGKTKKRKAKKQKSHDPVRPSTKVHDVVVFFGSMETDDYGHHECHGHDVANVERIRLPCLPVSQSYPECAVINQSLFIIGGSSDWSDGGTAVSSLTLSSDASELSWKSQAPFNEKRSSFAVTVLGKSIYVLGGLASSNSPVGTVECYDSDVDTWSAVAPLTKPRCNLAAVGMQNFVLAIGGGVGLGKESSNFVEKYSPSCNMWHRVARLHEKRRCPFAVCFGSKTYVMGGLSPGSLHPFSCEVYDARADEWSFIPHFQSPEHQINYSKLIGAFPLNGSLHLFFCDEFADDKAQVLKLNSKNSRLEEPQQSASFTLGEMWNAHYKAVLVQVPKFHLKLLPAVDEKSAHMADYDDDSYGDSYEDSWDVFDDYDDYDDDMMEDGEYPDWVDDWMF